MSKNNPEKFNVVIIGAGPGGYVAAIRCAQLGLKTACVDDWRDAENKPSPGGTCLNVGCIPSKAMIDSSEKFHHTQHGLTEHGIDVGEVKLNLKAMHARKNKVVRALTGGVAALFMANKITFIAGRAKILANKSIEIIGHKKSDSQSLLAENIIIATGSSPKEFKLAPFDQKNIVDSTGALEFTSVPKHLCLIGAGVIALELGSVWRRLGSEVTLLKSRKNFLPDVDQEISTEALKLFTAQGLNLKAGVKITSCKVEAKKVSIAYQEENQQVTYKADKLIVAVGRDANSQNIFDPSLAIELDDKGFIKVDEQCRTHSDGIFAIGDVVGGAMLAHKGSEEGIMVAELIAGHHTRVDYATIPAVIYTDPEIAWIGKTEQELQTAGVAYNAGKFSFSGNGRARAAATTEGFIKVLADKITDRILGVHIIGPQASELIMQAKLAMDFGASSEDIAMTMFAHPTLSETLHEAALSVDNRAIHAVQVKKK